MNGELIKSYEADGDSVISFDGCLTDEYQYYKLLINGLSVSLSDTKLGMRFGEASTYNPDASDYDYVTRWYTPNSTDSGEDSQTSVSIISVSGVEFKANSQYANGVEITLTRLKGAGYMSAFWDGIVQADDGYLNRIWGGANSSIDKLDSVQVFADNADTSILMDGTFSLYGIPTVRT